MKVDKDMMEMVCAAIKQAQKESAEIYEERWVTGKELSKEISMFTQNWLESFGWKLPRERIETRDKDGRTTATRWGYPIMQIKRMIAEGRMRTI